MKKQPRQIRGRIWLGRLKVTFSRLGAYVSYINFLMLILTFYTVKGHKYASLEVFLFIAILGIVVIGILDYFVMLPSEQAFLNEQFAKHQNPVYEEVKDIKKKLEEMGKKLK